MIAVRGRQAMSCPMIATHSSAASSGTPTQVDCEHSVPFLDESLPAVTLFVYVVHAVSTCRCHEDVRQHSCTRQSIVARSDGRHRAAWAQWLRQDDADPYLARADSRRSRVRRSAGHG